MSPFFWLLIAHLVGDWMLQNDWMARNKGTRFLNAACFVHCLIYSTTLTATLALVAPITPAVLARFALVILGTHWVIDGLHLAVRWGRLVHQSDKMFVQIMVDQTLHLLVVAAAVQYWLPG